MRLLQNLQACAIGAALAFGLGSQAMAVTVDQGDIDVLGNQSTVDFWFWSSDADGNLTMQIDPIPFGMGVLTGDENPAFYLYDSSFMLLDSVDLNGTGSNESLMRFLTAGDYIIGVSSSGLAANQFDPFHTNGVPAQEFTYEIAFSGSPVVTINCVQEGNTDGSFSQDGAGPCNLPSDDVPEPITLGLVGMGLIGVWGAGSAARRRRDR